MQASTAHPAVHGRPLWVKLLAGLAVLLLALVLLVVFFPWDVLRGPLNRYVSERTGRHFEITRKLDVKIGRNTRVIADGLVFANPDWAKDPQLVQAEAAEVDILLLPLLRGRIELPMVKLTKPQLGLQVEPDGRRSWALSRDTKDANSIPKIDALVVDQGSVHYIASKHGADIHTDFGLDERGDARLPLAFKARGTWAKEPFTAQGRAGDVLRLTSGGGSFPLVINAAGAHTTLKASGTVDNLATLDGTKADFTLTGANLSELYKLLGVVLPETPRYQVSGHLDREGEVWKVSKIDGKLGNSDLAGQLSFDRSHDVPVLSGKLQSRALDFDDLAPLVGLPEQPRSAAALPGVAPVAAGTVPAKVARDKRPPGRVLPTAELDLARLKAMDADVQYAAARITNVRELPLDRMSLHVKLKDGVLLLDGIDLGIAGGQMTGRLRIDGNSNPAVSSAKLDARSLELNKLFPGFKITKASFGKIHGVVDLKGRGNSAAKMLATSSGNVALLMGKGEISNLLLEYANLNGGEIIKFLVTGDRNAEVRCAAAAFDVNDGLMKTRALLLDTSDTVIYGDGSVSLANESLDLRVHPYPKHKGILSLRSPLKVGGTFSKPTAGVDKGALTGKAGVLLALGAVNPLLALAGSIESGPGKDADCRTVLQEAQAPAAAARAAAAGTPDPARPATPASGAGNPALMGAPGTTASPQEAARQRLEKLERAPQERDAAAAKTR
ncbi:AsmA family protein [Caenimonas terrae]|uniref:AsmA family protein n=1 Tax=Caenimonas terrae TaxID=696074 RepID=A0ABW0NGR0_9BURK